MMKARLPFLVRFLVLLLMPTCAYALEEADPALAEITNFRQYSASFASSGQPSREQFQSLADQGFERVVYIAFTNNDNALSDADRLVKSLGMEYMHVPVDFNNPLPDDFYAFADSMRRNPDKKTLLHCQVNARATAFSFLYRVIYEDVPVAEAKADMNSVWQPNAVWRDFIFAVLEENGISPDCESCDWTPPPPQN
ncbi:MAG: phosphatase [Gammaproteobacteria bacterium]|nr:phosphatase [Gammaproteobacteria bacterium]|tara:strand:- start:712 stop:1299 length:588 start_codon:yes stop_codon:yes gene_type:complete